MEKHEECGIENTLDEIWPVNEEKDFIIH